MVYPRRASYSRSPSPYERCRGRSRSRSSDSSDAENPGNSLYVTGLSSRVTKRELEKHFSTQGKVEDVNLVVDPLTRESRGFGFVTVSNLKEAERCIKYLDGSVLEGRVITVEKARRRRGRTPTPGRYLGPRTSHVRRRSPNYSPYSYRRDRSRSRSYSPYYYRRSRSRSYSPPYQRRRSHSLSYSRGRSYSRSRSPSYSRSPVRKSYYYRDYSPDDRNFRRSRYRSPDECYYYSKRRNRSITPPRRYRRYSKRTSYSPSVSPGCSRSYSHWHRRSTPRYSRRRDYSRSVSPKSGKGFVKRSVSRDSHFSRSHTRSPSVSSSSRSGSIRPRRCASP